MSVNSLPVDGDYVVAFSGGIDSTVLLHQCCQRFKQGLMHSLRAVYVNHGLQQQAERWAEHCQAVCSEWGVDCVILKVRVVIQRGESVEAFARQQRYQLLFDHLAEHEVLLTAQHQEDQAETFLLQALRGAGPYGLASMGQSDRHQRPLLHCSKKTIIDYAAEHGLRWVEDDSNGDARYSRNFLRNQVMPLLQQHWGNVSQPLARAAQHQQQCLTLLDDLAEMDCRNVQGDYSQTLSITALECLSQVRRQHVFRYWLRQRAIAVPCERQCREIFQQISHAQPHANPSIEWHHAGIAYVAYRYRDQLFVHDLKSVCLEPADIPDVYRCYDVVWKHSGKSVKKLFQSFNVPPRWRSSLPVFYCQGQLQKHIDYQYLFAKLIAKLS